MKLFVFVGIMQVEKCEFLKFRILEILNFHPCVNHILAYLEFSGILFHVFPIYNETFSVEHEKQSIICASIVLPISESGDRIFYPTLTLMMDSYNLT